MTDPDNRPEPERPESGEWRELPLFPLGVVQFPTTPLDLQIFEPRYLTLLKDLADREPQEFGVVAIRSGHEVGPGNVHGMAEAGCAVRIRTRQPMIDRVLIRAVGTWRFDSIELTESGRPYVTARVRALPEDAPPAEEAGVRLRSALLAYARAAAIDVRTLPADPLELAWWTAAGGPFTQLEQIRVLAAPPDQRLDLLTRWLRRETSLLQATGSVPFRTDRRTRGN